MSTPNFWLRHISLIWHTLCLAWTLECYTNDSGLANNLPIRSLVIARPFVKECIRELSLHQFVVTARHSLKQPQAQVISCHWSNRGDLEFGSARGCASLSARVPTSLATVATWPRLLKLLTLNITSPHVSDTMFIKSFMLLVGYQVTLSTFRRFFLQCEGNFSCQDHKIIT